MPHSSQPYYKAVNGAFSQFYGPIAVLLPGVPSDSTSARLIMEALSRLRQLDFLYDQIVESEDIVGRLVGEPWPMFLPVPEAMFRCQLYAEAFYLFAFRFFDITRYLNKGLFGKDNICPQPQGVRDVRNYLIIHPTKKKEPVLNRSFDVSMADGRGVVLKSKRLPGEGADPVDKGFRANAAEFQRFIENWIDEAARRRGISST